MGVQTSISGSAAVITLDWPEQKNALGPDECLEFAAALRSAGEREDICSIIITGNGAFCAGGNLKGAAQRAGMSDEERRDIVYSAYQGVVRALIDLPVPTIAAIDGPAIGLGFDIALACDSRFIGAEGWCMQGWGRVSFAPGTGGEWLLRQKAPGLLWRLLEEQPKIGAEQAAAWGIAEPALEQTALERALVRAAALEKMGREALEAYVRLSRMDTRAGLDAHLLAAVNEQLRLLSHPKVKERIAKALGKAV